MTLSEYLIEAVARRKAGKYVNVSKKTRMVEWSLAEVSEMRRIVDDFTESKWVKQNRTDGDIYCLQSFSLYILDHWKAILEKGEVYAADMLTIGELKMMYDACKWCSVIKDKSRGESKDFLEFLNNYIRNSNRFRIGTGESLEKFFGNFTYRSV